MKIIINYDLIEKILEANNGFSLNKSAKIVLRRTLIVTTITTILNISDIIKQPELLLKPIIYYLQYYSILGGICDMMLIKLTKQSALNDLKKLSHTLKNLDISTNQELLLKSYKYATNYEFGHNKSTIPKIKQNKYIIVPIYDNGKEKEISILQEHILGTNQYYLSYGSPTKSLKLAFNPS